MNTKEEEYFPYYLIQQFSDGLHALLFIVNKENTIEFANEKFLTYFECTSMDTLTSKKLSLFKYVSGNKKLKNYTELHQYILPNEHRTLSINDDIFILDTTKLDTDKMLFTLKKVTKIFNKKADLEKEVAYDSLTGLLRKKYLDIELEMLLEKKENLVLIVVDIDDFKAINDVY
jgi:predicted signal transduction protein with EAL and GGDEF domain